MKAIAMLEATAGIQRETARTDRSWTPAVGAVATTVGSVAVMVLVAVVLVQFRDSLVGTGAWGYAGVFLAELGNTVVILVPTPAHAYTFAAGATLNPWVLGILSGTGAALGELTGYYLGLKGRRVVEGGEVYERMRALTARWTGAALFTFAALPVPFDVAGVGGGAQIRGPQVPSLCPRGQDDQGHGHSPGGILWSDLAPRLQLAMRWRN